MKNKYRMNGQTRTRRTRSIRRKKEAKQKNRSCINQTLTNIWDARIFIAKM